MFVLTHEPPDPPDPEVTFLTGDIDEAVVTALDAADGKNLEILGADVAAQCLQRGLVDEILVYVLPVLQDRPGTARQHAVRSRHHSPLPRPHAIIEVGPPPVAGEPLCVFRINVSPRECWIS
jgi:hypothetical protein